MDMDTLGYFIFMDEQERKARQKDEEENSDESDS